MKGFFYSFLFIFLFHHAAFSQTESHQDKVFWSDWYKLEWQDFQSKDKPEGSNVAAESSIALPYKFVSDQEGYLKVTINVCFVKSKSWSDTSRQNNVLLQHERLHFDIGELHRRMIVKALLEAKFDKENYVTQLDAIVKEIWNNKYRNMQDKYDAETRFSRIIREQVNWNKFIAQQLDNYKDYTFNEVELSLIQFDE